MCHVTEKILIWGKKDGRIDLEKRVESKKKEGKKARAHHDLGLTEKKEIGM